MTDVSGPEDLVLYAKTVVGHAAFRAGNQGRDDLVERLHRQRTALDQLDGAAVVVVGLCDAGKSSLVNACIGQPLVPIDLVHPTPVPVMVRGNDSTIRLHTGDGEAGAVITDLNDAVRALTTPVRSLHGLRLVELGCSDSARPPSLVLVDTPSASLGSVAARSLLMGLDPDVIVLVTDGGQELSQVELATIADAHERGTRVVVVLTKTDLHAHWHRIRDVDEEHLRRAGLDVPLVPVSTRLYELGRARFDSALVAESGMTPLFEILDGIAAGARESFLCARALEAVTQVTTELVDDLRGQRELLTNPEAAQRANDELLKTHQRVERLKGAGARWRERLYDGLERLQLETEHDLRTRMGKLQSDALEEIEAADPVEIWPVFSGRLERLVDAEVTSVFVALEDNSRRLADDVAELFGDEGGLDLADLALGEHGHVPEDVRLQTRLEGMEDGHSAGSAINAIRGSAASLSVTAIITRYGALLVGGALVNAVLLPVGAAMTLLLGHHALKATREGRTATRRRAATLAVRKYLDSVSPEVAVRMRSDLMNVRVELRDHFERAATVLATKIDAEMRVAVDSLRISDQQRQQRITAIDEELEQIELVAAHASRAKSMLMTQGLPA